MSEFMAEQHLDAHWLMPRFLFIARVAGDQGWWSCRVPVRVAVPSPASWRSSASSFGFCLGGTHNDAVGARRRLCSLGGEGQWLIGASGHLLNRNSAGNQWRRARQAVGLDGSTLHDCRHFFASGPITSGCDIVTVQRALGHSSPTITRSVYAHP